jgi:hypothetical protein
MTTMDASGVPYCTFNTDNLWHVANGMPHEAEWLEDGTCGHVGDAADEVPNLETGQWETQLLPGGGDRDCDLTRAYVQGWLNDHNRGDETA